VFDDDRYFDVFMEYAKEGPEDVLIRVMFTIAGRKQHGFACCRRCGSGTRGRGVRTIESRPCARRASVSFKPHTMNWVSTGCIAMELRSCCSPRMRAMRSVSGTSPVLLPMSRMRSTLTSFGTGRGGESRQAGTKAAAHYVLEVPAAAARRSACGSHPSQ